jgi:hypothetical protein
MAPLCGLCGRADRDRLTPSLCCGWWVCDDEHDDELYPSEPASRNCCQSLHRTLTLCGHHFAERHRGSWRKCAICRKQFDRATYEYLATNPYNLERPDGTPRDVAERCASCGAGVVLGKDSGRYETDLLCLSCLPPF